MGLNASKIKGGGSKSKAPLLDAMNYPARLVQVIDLGLQAQRPYQGKEKPAANQLWCTYELPSEFMPKDDGTDDLDAPRWVSERMNLFSLSAEQATSTKRMLGLDPSGAISGDWSRAVGLPCTLTIVHRTSNGTTYANIGAVSAPMKGMTIPDIVDDSKAHFFDLDNPDMDVYNSLPDFLKEIITANLEFKGSPLANLLSNGPTAATTADDDDEVAPY